VNHILPRSKGGATTIDNLVLQCPNCSLHKSDKTQSVDPVTGETVSLFHPLQDDWADPFRLESDGACVGLTPVGRASVVALHMNDAIPRIARLCQMILGFLSPT
jgi:hypothetical protein